MKPRNVIIDCDPGVDDALALLLALRSPALRVLGITTVAGNVPVEKVTRNALVIVENSGKIVPVYQGCRRAIMGHGETAEYAHGSDGLGDVGFADPSIKIESEHSIDFLARSFKEADDPIDLITLGPLTNVAMALIKEPGIVKKIHSLVMMAGGNDNGNSTPAAEFNIFVDPEAADIVFRSGIPSITMVGLEPNHQGGQISPEDVARIEASDSTWCNMAGRLLRSQLSRWKEFTGEARPSTPPDLTAMGVALKPEMAKIEVYPVIVETTGQNTRGMTLVDRRHYRHMGPETHFPEINVVMKVDNAQHRKLFLDTLLN